MKTSSMILACLAATTIGLRAESPRYGVQGLLNIPLGDLKTYVDSKPGPGVGIHGTFDLGEGHMLRPRLDFSAFPETSSATLKQTATNLSLGADYLYFIAEKPEGLYFIAGLAAARWSFETKVDAAKTTSTTTKIGAAAGAGYQWNATLGTEARLVHSRIAHSFNANAFQLGVTVRF